MVLHAPTRKSVGVFGAVCAGDGRLAIRWEEKFQATTFLAFLKQLLRHRRKGRMMIVIVDNARWHHARYLYPWLEAHHDLLRLDFLPPYSPELNAIERVWKLTRRICTHNQYFPVLDDLIDTVYDQFALWTTPNTTLRRLCAVT